MMDIIQTKLFDCETKSSKRVRHKPIWKKFYSVYAYDFTKYHFICDAVQSKNYLRLFNLYPDLDKKIILSFSRFDEYKIRKLCYILDDDKNKKHNGDEKHIFRLKTLHKLYEKLYFYANLPAYATEDYINRIKSEKDISLSDAAIIFRIEELETKGYRIYFDKDYGNQLEIINTELLSIKERLITHIQLLRKIKTKEVVL